MGKRTPVVRDSFFSKFRGDMIFLKFWMDGWVDWNGLELFLPPAVKGVFVPFARTGLFPVFVEDGVIRQQECVATVCGHPDTLSEHLSIAFPPGEENQKAAEQHGDGMFDIA